MANFCKHCGRAINPTSRFCKNCGREIPKKIVSEGTPENAAKMQAQPVKCRYCGNPVPAQARFCKYCGAGFSYGTGDEPLQSIVRQGESASGNMNANNTGSVYYREPVPALQPANNSYSTRYPQYNSSKDVPFTTAFWGGR